VRADDGVVTCPLGGGLGPTLSAAGVSFVHGGERISSDPAGVPLAFERLVRLRGPALVRTAYLMTGDPFLAEDLVQAALTKTYLRWGRLRHEDAAEAYVRKVMMSLAGRWWQRKWNGERPTEVLPEAPAATDDYAVVDERAATRALLMSLAPRQRAVLVLRYYEDLPEREVAEVLGMSVGTVKSTTSKALARLRVLRGQQDDGSGR
jgi:RNA polymerase sigma-70 factor (ECF subfamily)